MFNYIELPNKLFYSYKEDELSIFQQIKDANVILILDYLYINTNKKDTSIFTLEDMILNCGYKKVDRHKGKNLEQFKNILIKLQELKIIKTDVDFSSIKPSTLIKCKLDLIKENEGFVQLFDTEKDKIISFELDNLDNKKLLIYYCYLKSRMYKRSKEQGDMVCHGGRAEICFPSYNTISKDLGITDDTINKYNKILNSLNLIRIGSAGNWYYIGDKNKFLHESVNIYTLFTGDEEFARFNLAEGIKYYKSLDINSNKVFTNSKKYKNNNRKLNGELGSIIKKENRGTATDKDIKRKNEIISFNSQNEEQYKIKALFDINKDMLLSDIYYSFYTEKSDETADKYYKLEKDLCLLNNNDDLTVDWDYYCWVMENYTEDKQVYFRNCVLKHIQESKLKESKVIHLDKLKPRRVVTDQELDLLEEVGGEIHTDDSI